MRVADAVLTYLGKNDVKYIFSIPAGTTSALSDAIVDSKIKAIITKNEAGAIYSAQKYASISRKLGVSIVAGGVGINNGINGIADAQRSKTPLLIISGCVHRWQMGKGAIQELDTEKMIGHITKYSKTVRGENEVLTEIKKAIEIAFTPPFGPVHISIPIDVQTSKMAIDLPSKVSFVNNEEQYDLNKLNEAISIINSEEKGIMMVGKGCRGLSKEVKCLSKHLDWPIITTPEAKGVIPIDFKYNLGNYGFSSTDAAKDYVKNGYATCILILGSSLGESATRNFNDILVKNKKVIHIDWDKSEFNKVFKTDISIYYDLSLAIPRLIHNTSQKKKRFFKPKQINKPYEKNHTGLSIRLFMEKLVDYLPNGQFISDIGEYMNFLFKYLPIRDNMDFEISLNYGAMGTGIGGAMGAYLANPNKQTVVIVGDGSFAMNGSEILTAKDHKMPILYVIINNAMLGYVHHGQSFVYGRTVDGALYDRIHISQTIKTLGIKSITIKDISEMDKISGFIKDIDGPRVIELITDGSELPPIADRFKSVSNNR